MWDRSKPWLYHSGFMSKDLEVALVSSLQHLIMLFYWKGLQSGCGFRSDVARFILSSTVVSNIIRGNSRHHQTPIALGWRGKYSSSKWHDIMINRSSPFVRGDVIHWVRPSRTPLPIPSTLNAQQGSGHGRKERRKMPLTPFNKYFKRWITERSPDLPQQTGTNFNRSSLLAIENLTSKWTPNETKIASTKI